MTPTPPPITGNQTAYAHLATGPGDVMDIAIDDTYVYWLVNHQSIDTSEVYRVAKTGGASELLAHVPGRVYQFALDATSIYLPVYVQGATGGAFLRVAKTGGALETIDDHLRYLAFAAVADGVPYTAPLVSEDPVNYELWRYPGTGCHEVVATNLDGPEALVSNAERVYVTTAGDSHLQRAVTSGGPTVQPIPSLRALHVLSDGARIYFMSNAVDYCPDAHITAWRPGDTTTADLGSLAYCASDMALSPRGVVAANTYTHALIEFPLDGSGPYTLADSLRAPMAVAIEPDGSAIYWGDYETGEINRIDQ